MVAYLSLGLNCQPVMSAIETGLVPNREGGRHTAVFDLCWTTSEALCHFIHTEFVDFFDDIELIGNPEGRFQTPTGQLLYSFVSNEAYGDLIVNSRYGMIFNHESPGHPFLSGTEGWDSPHRFCQHDFQEFRERYERRIATFLATIQSCIEKDRELVFLLMANAGDVAKVTAALAAKYPTLRFRILHSEFPAIDKVIHADLQDYFHGSADQAAGGCTARE